MSIEGLKGREPIGAVLTVGRKNPESKFPEHTDRFYLVLPQEVDGVRHEHPSFRPFNHADPEKRTVIRGNLVHSTRDGCFGYKLKAQVLPGVPEHPQKRPHCTGDGVKAERWDPESKTFKQIACPNEKCQFRQPYMHNGKERPSPCKPDMKLLFRIRWPEGNPLPSMLVKYVSGAWNTTGFVVGFFDYIEKQAASMGIKEPNLYGFPFQMVLTRKKRSGDKSTARAFPVVQITPEMDVIDFLRQQHVRLAEIGVTPVVSLLEVVDPEEELADSRSLSGPVVIDVPSRE